MPTVMLRHRPLLFSRLIASRANIQKEDGRKRGRLRVAAGERDKKIDSNWSDREKSNAEMKIRNERRGKSSFSLSCLPSLSSLICRQFLWEHHPFHPIYVIRHHRIYHQ